jgi:hypothetical protein
MKYISVSQQSIKKNETKTQISNLIVFLYTI